MTLRARFLITAVAIVAATPSSAQQWAIFESCCQTAALLPSGTSGASQLSGITWAGGSQFYVVGDNDPIVYPLSLTIDPSNGVITDPTLSPGIPLAAGDDLEGLAYDPVAGTLLISDETGPAIREHAVSDGALLQTLALPPVFAAHRPNLSLESLTRAPDGSALWTANEEALTVDGPVSSLVAGTIVRLQRFDAAFAPNGQWAYVTDPLPGDIGAPGRDFEVSGVVDLAALDDGRLLVLERALGGLALRSRIYEVDVTGATDVSAIPNLSSATFTPANKILLHDGIETVNFEGMTLGPTLANGVRSLLLVSDNAGGGDSSQLLRHFLLRRNPPVCSPQPRSGCSLPGASKLLVLKLGTRDQLTWSWRKGSLADVESLLGNAYIDFGIGFGLCVYDSQAGVPRLRIAAEIPRAGFGWGRPRGDHAAYVDADGTASGVRRIVVRPGTGNASVRVRASGPALNVPPPPVLVRDPEVTVQFVNRAQPEKCLTATFTVAGRDLAHRFAAKF